MSKVYHESMRRTMCKITQKSMSMILAIRFKFVVGVLNSRNGECFNGFCNEDRLFGIRNGELHDDIYAYFRMCIKGIRIPEKTPDCLMAHLEIN